MIWTLQSKTQQNRVHCYGPYCGHNMNLSQKMTTIHYILTAFCTLFRNLFNYSTPMLSSAFYSSHKLTPMASIVGITFTKVAYILWNMHMVCCVLLLWSRSRFRIFFILWSLIIVNIVNFSDFKHDFTKRHGSNYRLYILRQPTTPITFNFWR